MDTSVFFCYMVDMLMSNNVQWSMGKKHFHRRYGATHKATHPRFTYIEDAVMCVMIRKTWTVSCLHCPIVTVKVFLLYAVRHQHVCHVMEEYGRVHPVKTHYTVMYKVAKLPGHIPCKKIPPPPPPPLNATLMMLCHKLFEALCATHCSSGLN